MAIEIQPEKAMGPGGREPGASRPARPWWLRPAIHTAVAEAPSAFRVVCADPDHETENVERLYQAFVQAKAKTGEDTHKLSPAGFKEFVRKKTKDLQEKQKCQNVEYVVEVIAGHVKLKALVKS